MPCYTIKVARISYFGHLKNDMQRIWKHAHNNGLPTVMQGAWGIEAGLARHGTIGVLP